MPGAGRVPALLLPERLCMDAGGRIASLQHGDQGLWIRGQQTPLLLRDRLGFSSPDLHHFHSLCHGQLRNK